MKSTIILVGRKAEDYALTPPDAVWSRCSEH